MRNRIAKLVTIGLTVILTGTGVFGLPGSGMQTVHAAEGYRAPAITSPNPDYPGAYVKDPEYPSNLKTDPNSDHYTFMISRPVKNHVAGKTIEEEKAQQYAEYVVFSTDRNGSRNLYVSVVDKNGAISQVGKLDWNTSNSGALNAQVDYRTWGDITFTQQSVTNNNVLAILNNTIVVKNMDGLAYISGYYDNMKALKAEVISYLQYYYGYSYTNANNYADSYVKHNGAYRLYSLDEANMENLMKTISDPIPKLTDQTTRYIGRVRDENGILLPEKDWIQLDIYTQEGLDGQSYHIPDAKAFEGWRLVKSPRIIEGKIGDGYHEGDIVHTIPMPGYLVVYEVTDNDGTVTEKIYRAKRLGGTGIGSYTYEGEEYVLIHSLAGIAPGESSGVWPDKGIKNGASIVMGNPLKFAAMDVAYYYEKIEPEKPEEYDVKTQGRTITLTKPLRVQNIAHEYTPSVPDMKFTYRVAYERNTNASVAELNAAKTDYKNTDIDSKYMAVAEGVDANKTKFEVWRGPFGAITVDEELVFSHGDSVDENKVVTKKINVTISGGDGKDTKGYFTRPGVYRFPIEETGMREIDFGEAGKDEANVTGNDENGVRLTELDRDVESDIVLKEEKQLRYLDVYVEWNGNEDGFVIKDVVLHDIEGDLDYEKLNDKDKAFSEKKTDEVSNEEKTGTKKTGFSQSVYTTYDLVIGKEIMGKGLTNYDTTKRLFKFDVTITGPAYTKVGQYLPVNGNMGTAKDLTIPESGVLTTSYEMKQGEYVLLSGLPSGVTYQVTEVNNPLDARDNEPDALDVFETYNTNKNDLQDIIEAKQDSMLNDQSARNVHMMTLQGEHATILSEIARVRSDDTLTDEQKDEEIAKLEAQKSNLSLVQNVATDTKVLGKRQAYESVNNVFFLNVRYDNVNTGVAMSVAPYALMVLAAVIGVGGFLVLKKRRDAEFEE
ncbi:MAG: hypothetical protein IJR58_02370 [Lachnospiraceae bacterium]|nr:hypothetical protein [Lachnospiraceae bacterium]